MAFYFKRIKITVTLPFCFLVTAMLIIDKTGLLTHSLIATLLHEFGHLICMQRVGCSINEVKFGFGGVIITAPLSPADTRDRLFIAACGPGVNVLAAAITAGIGYFLKADIFTVHAAVELITGIINFLPVNGLDGGTIAGLLISSKMPQKAAKASGIISLLFTAAVIVSGIFLIICGGSNPTLLLLGIYLALLNIPRLGIIFKV